MVSLYHGLISFESAPDSTCFLCSGVFLRHPLVLMLFSASLFFSCLALQLVGVVAAKMDRSPEVVDEPSRLLDRSRSVRVETTRPDDLPRD